MALMVEITKQAMEKKNENHSLAGDDTKKRPILSPYFDYTTCY